MVAIVGRPERQSDFDLWPRLMWVAPGAISSFLVMWRLVTASEGFVEWMVASFVYFVVGFPLDSFGLGGARWIVGLIEVGCLVLAGAGILWILKKYGTTSGMAAVLTALTLLVLGQLLLGAIDPVFYLSIAIPSLLERT